MTYHHKTYPITIARLKDYSSKEKTPPSTYPYCSGVSSIYPELEANLGSEIVFELMRTGSTFLCSSWCEDTSEAGELHGQVFATGNSRATRVEDILKENSTTKLQGIQPMTVPDARVLGMPMDRRREEIAEGIGRRPEAAPAAPETASFTAATIVA